MKTFLLLLFVLALSGCYKGMTLEEQIESVTKCKKAGGTPQEIRYMESNKLVRVDCTFQAPRDYGKPCSDKGGVPLFSTWDGRLIDCKFKGTK